MGARDVIEKGARWIIGNGATIDIWNNPWVTTLPRGRVASYSGDGEGCPPGGKRAVA